MQYPFSKIDRATPHRINGATTKCQNMLAPILISSASTVVLKR